MARAHAVWVVMAGNQALPVGTWTVKHELATWLKRGTHDVSKLEVYRYPDGWRVPVPADPPRQVVKVSMAELMS